MLIFSRQVGESIRLGGVTVTIVDIKQNKVRIGVQGPPGTRIIRTEFLELSRGGLVAGAGEHPDGDETDAGRDSDWA